MVFEPWSTAPKLGPQEKNPVNECQHGPVQR